MKNQGLIALSLFAVGGMASAPATEVEMVIDVAGVERKVVFTLDEEIAPKTSANFAELCNKGFYDGIAFHRVIPNYVVQGGDPLTKNPSIRSKWGTGGPGYNVPAELGGKHIRGAVAASRMGDANNPYKESSGSQFYITLREVTPLDGQYTVFGMISSGLEVFDEIAGAPADAKYVPKESIKIVSTKVIKSEPAPAPPATSLTATEMAPPKPAAVNPPPTPEPTPAPPAPTPAAMASHTAATTSPPSAEPNPLSADAPSRFTPQAEEKMPVNVDRGMPSVPRLQTNADKMVEAAKKLTGREDGFVPMTAVGGSNTAQTPPASSPPPSAASDLPPMPAFPQEPEPQPSFPREPEPIPLSASEPDPLSPGSAPASGAGAPVPPTGEMPPAEANQKPQKPAGPLGRFIRRIW